MWSFGQGAGHLVNLTVSTPPDLPPPSSSNQATAWRVIAEPPCFDALDLYDLKSHFHFLATKKEHISLIAKRQIFSVLCSRFSFHSIWFPFEGKTLKSISIFIHQCLSVIWRPLQQQSTSQLQPRGTQQGETINKREKQFALMWSVLLLLTAIFLILWQACSDSFWTEGKSVRPRFMMMLNTLCRWKNSYRLSPSSHWAFRML